MDTVPIPAEDRKGESAPLQRIAELLICPACSADLSIRDEDILCRSCGATYPMRNGVPLLARLGTSNTWGETQQTPQSETYQEQYQEIDDATEYNLEYRAELLKRASTRREYKIIRALVGQRHCGTILDLPCGGGRLTPAFAEAADLIIEADIALGQVLWSIKDVSISTPRILMTASAFHIPLRDNSVDATVCVRLCHHLPTAAERERLVGEILRVSRQFVLMTYFDFHSVKNTLRRLRQPFTGKPPKMTMKTSRVAALAKEHGAELVACPALSFLGSGHRYALMVKNSA